MELFDLEQLAAFADCGTLSAAAEKLHLSQPTLTKTMKRLENEFQVPLFIRAKNKLELNENGILAAEKAHKILADSKEMIQLIRSIDRERHTISIGACAPIPSIVLSQRASFLYKDMTITSELKSNEILIEGLKSEKYQLIILPYKPAENDYVTKEYGSEKLYFVLPQNHRLAKRKSISLSEMDGENMLLFSDIGFWHDIVTTHMPHSRFLVQTQRYDFNELTHSSILPFFGTDATLRFSDIPADRIAVPVKDEDAAVTYYAICLHQNLARFDDLFH